MTVRGVVGRWKLLVLLAVVSWACGPEIECVKRNIVTFDGILIDVFCVPVDDPETQIDCDACKVVQETFESPQF
jgi:hypothetical protein